MLGISSEPAFSSKAEAMSFSIIMCMTTDESGRRTVDYPKTKELFDFINANVKLPEVKTEPMVEMIDSVVKGFQQGVKEAIEDASKTKSKCCKCKAG